MINFLQFGIILILALGCEEVELRDQSRPTDDGSEIPDFEAENTESVKANKAATITISNTRLILPADALGEDSEVRLRTLKSRPEREAVASLGEAKGDVVELTFYHKETNEIFGSNVLDSPYELSQSLNSVEDDKYLKFVVISSPDTDEEKVSVIGRSALTTSASLTTSSLVVNFSLSITHAVVYAVESSESPVTVIVITDTGELSNSGGPSVSTSSSSSSSSSGGASSSGGEIVTCTGLAGGDWIAVPANTVVNQAVDFCVMKYEAKNLGGVATSQVSGSPWTNIARGQDKDSETNLYPAGTARRACQDLGEGYTLITNPMWQTIARNIETAKNTAGEYFNWDQGSNALDSYMNVGHSNGAPSDKCDAAFVFVENLCSEAGEPKHWQKRTHILSNGTVIWDFAGNVEEWVNDHIGTFDMTPTKIAHAFFAGEETTWGPTLDYHSAGPLPKNGPWYGGLGQFNSGTSGAVKRGGWFGSDANAGVFASSFEMGPTVSSSASIGFRCAWTSP